MYDYAIAIVIVVLFEVTCHMSRHISILSCVITTHTHSHWHWHRAPRPLLSMKNHSTPKFHCEGQLGRPFPSNQRRHSNHYGSIGPEYGRKQCRSTSWAGETPLWFGMLQGTISIEHQDGYSWQSESHFNQSMIQTSEIFKKLGVTSVHVWSPTCATQTNRASWWIGGVCIACGPTLWTESQVHPEPPSRGRTEPKTPAGPTKLPLYHGVFHHG